MNDKPFSQPCENNKNAILKKIKPVFSQSNHILEIGSGTGQHAIHFGECIPHLCWQTSDLEVNHVGIQQWISESELANVISPVELDLTCSKSALESIKSLPPYDGVFSANTLHIISIDLVKAFFEFSGNLLGSEQPLVVYGPFNYDGRFTSESNQNFDLWLKDRDHKSGIRDIEFIYEQAEFNAFELEEDHEMPANNRLLVFRKT